MNATQGVLNSASSASTPRLGGAIVGLAVIKDNLSSDLYNRIKSDYTSLAVSSGGSDEVSCTLDSIRSAKASLGSSNGLLIIVQIIGNSAKQVINVTVDLQKLKISAIKCNFYT